MTALICGFAVVTHAEQRSVAEVREMVEGWLELSRNTPLHERVSGRIASEEIITREDGAVVGYVFNLSPEGFVVTSADDRVEPVIAFSKRGRNALDPAGPLSALVMRDLPARLAFVQARPQGRVLQGVNAPEETQRWAWFRSGGKASGPGLMGSGIPDVNVSDMRVAPLVRSHWDQSAVNGQDCYNYYTPNNYCGCVATAWAQIMRYYQYPTAGIGIIQRTISVGGNLQPASTRGGDGAGGPYQWSQMPYEPNSGCTLAERQAIGALTYDIGVAVSVTGVGMITEYTSSGTGAYMPPEILKSIFNYASVYRFESAVNRENAINANLDAGMPVNVCVPGHSVVCDGYGFHSNVAYHHLNLGWGGYEDAWYTLGTFIAGPYGFNGVEYIYANISPSITGEIISGRVIDGSTQQPVAGATVTLTPGNRTAQSDAAGIYAFTGVAANTSYTLTAAQSGYTFAALNVTTGGSIDKSNSCGNRWGNTFTGVMSGSHSLVSGTLAAADGTPITGVTLRFTPDGGTTQTDANGSFTHPLPLGWSGTVEPLLERGYSDPALYTVDALTAPLSGLDFTVTMMAFVDARATGTNTGASWADAYTNLTTALAARPASPEIWVAEGTYTPPEGNRGNAFFFASGQKVYGGFAGTETRREQRDVLQNATVLSGNIGDKAVATDNCYNVIRGAAGAVIDGVTIIDGYADDAVYGDNLTLEQFAHGRGSAVFFEYAPSTDAASFVVDHCIISNNYAIAQGGAVFGCIARNSILTANRGTFAAGAESIFENCTITKNNTSNYAPSIRGTAINCIIHGDTPEINGSYLGVLVANYCCLDALSAGALAAGNANNISSDPKWLSLPAMPFMVTNSSPCVNAGTPLLWMNDRATDIFGDARVSGTAPDIGAYELQATHSTFNAAPPPAGQQLLSPAGFTVSCKTRYGWTYTLMYSVDLATWDTIDSATVPGDGTVKNLVDPNPSAPAKFYRIQAARAY